MDHSGSSFLCGCAPFTDMIFFAKELDELAAADQANTGFFLWDQQIADENKRWMKYDTAASWRAVGLATVKPAGQARIAVAVGSAGQFFEVDAENLVETVGMINPSVTGLRCLLGIEDVIFAAGMGRIVFERAGTGQWTAVGPGLESSERNVVLGFEGMDGFSARNLYAVGWGGEIWNYVGRGWTKIDSPTNGNLNAVACVGDADIYAVGDNGLLVHGHGDNWVAVDSGRPENLQDVAFSDGVLYVSTDFRILRLDDDGLVEADNFADGDRPATCQLLLKSGDGLVSLGPKDVFALRNGVWHRVV